MPKTTLTEKRRATNVAQYVRLSGPRNRAVRAVKPPPLPPPRIPFDGERQTFVCLYLNLITSEHPEVDIAQEFWRCYKHLLEGGTLANLPIMLIDREAFLEELARVKAQKSYLLDDPIPKEEEP